MGLGVVGTGTPIVLIPAIPLRFHIPRSVSSSATMRELIADFTGFGIGVAQFVGVFPRQSKSQMPARFHADTIAQPGFVRVAIV